MTNNSSELAKSNIKLITEINLKKSKLIELELDITELESKLKKCW